MKIKVKGTILFILPRLYYDNSREIIIFTIRYNPIALNVVCFCPEVIPSQNILMKKYVTFLLASILMVMVGCDRDNSLLESDEPTISVTIPRSYSNSAVAAVFANDIKSLGIFTIGVCYSITESPGIEDSHAEIQVNPDTLILPNLTLNLNLTGLSKGTRYFTRGYIKNSSRTFYSEQLEFNTQQNTLTIKVSDDYIPDGREYWISLSDDETPILTQKLENNKTYTFSEGILDLADFHIYKYYINNNRTYLYVESYTDIVPDNIELDNPYTPAPVAGQVNVTISDISNFLRWGIAGSWWYSQTSTATTKTLTTAMYTNPDNIFVNCIPADGSAPRYKYLNNVNAGSNLTFMMADLTPMTAYKEIILPENIYFTYSLAGFNNDYYSDYLRYHSWYYPSGYSGTFRLYYPQSVKSNFYFTSILNTSTTQSYIFKQGPLPTEFFSTFPNIIVNSFSVFKTASSSVDNFSDYEIIDLCGLYSNSLYYIRWDYYAEPKSSNTVKVPEYPKDIKTRINNMSVNDLPFSDAGYFNILNSPVNSYSSYVDLLIKKHSRTYDVVKEARHYYKFGNKGSSEKNLMVYNSAELN